jgi:hypothetical protein
MPNSRLREAISSSPAQSACPEVRSISHQEISSYVAEPASRRRYGSNCWYRDQSQCAPNGLLTWSAVRPGVPTPGAAVVVGVAAGGGSSPPAVQPAVSRSVTATAVATARSRPGRVTGSPARAG